MVVEFGIAAKLLQRRRVSSNTWVDVESLSAAKLYLYEDEVGYSAALNAAQKKGIKILYRVVVRFKLRRGTAEEGPTKILTNKTIAVASAKKWAATERRSMRAD
jgi:hypothetical protein